MTKSDFTIYTDGACDGNGGPASVGSYGAVVINHVAKTETDLHPVKAFTDVTNNQMEMLAALMALQHVAENHPKGTTVEIFSDSQYLVKGMTDWMKGWKKRDWITSDKQPVKNRDLWQVLDMLSQELTVKWTWVRGHNGDHYNERADYLASLAVDKYLHRKLRSQPRATREPAFTS